MRPINNQIMKKLVYSILALRAIFVSCDKEDDIANQNDNNNNPLPAQKVYLPTKLINEDYVTTYTYDANGQLTKVVESDGYEYLFTYEGTKLTKAVSVEMDGQTIYTFSQTGSTVTVTLLGQYGDQTYNDTHIFN